MTNVPCKRDIDERNLKFVSLIDAPVIAGPAVVYIASFSGVAGLSTLVRPNYKLQLCSSVFGVYKYIFIYIVVSFPVCGKIRKPGINGVGCYRFMRRCINRFAKFSSES